MRLFLLNLLAAALLSSTSACATAQTRPDSPAAQSTADRNLYPRGDSIALTRQPAATIDPQAYTRQLFSRFHERVVDVEEHRSGPGYPMLTHISLYERPEALHLAGLCQVRVHDVSVNTAPPPAEPPRHATSVRTSTRYFAIGPVSSTIPPPDQAQRCAALPNARNFFTAASRDDAFAALSGLTSARYFAANTPRAISFTCKSDLGSCGDPAALFTRYMTPDRIKSVERIPCPDGASDGFNPCFRYGFWQLADGSGGWTISSEGNRRPVRLHLEQLPPPVV